MRGRRLHGKRVFFRFNLANALLVVDYQALDAALAAPGEERDTQLAHFKQLARERLRAAIANHDEVDGRESITDDPTEVMVRFLAVTIEQGAFEVRERGKTTLTLFRLTHHVRTEMFGSDGRSFMLSSCRPLFSVRDGGWVR